MHRQAENYTIMPLSIVFWCIVYRDWRRLQLCEKEEESSRSSVEQKTTNSTSAGRLVRDGDIVMTWRGGSEDFHAGF